MAQKPTHRRVSRPTINARYLADFMAGSERARRTIVRDCCYRSTARIVQHDRAKTAIARFLLEGLSDCDTLTQSARRLRNMMADDDFERDLLDNNADFIDRFAAVFPSLNMPNAFRERVTGLQPLTIHGVKVAPDAIFALSRVTRTNRVRTGLCALRYAKGKPLNSEVGAWQSSFLFGYRLHLDDGYEAEPEQQLCVTIDAFAGEVYPAPSDALSRFRNMEAACQSIAERWQRIEPPPNAVL